MVMKTDQHRGVAISVQDTIHLSYMEEKLHTNTKVSSSKFTFTNSERLWISLP